MSEPEYRWNDDAELAAVLLGLDPVAVIALLVSPRPRVEHKLGDSMVVVGIEIRGRWYLVVCDADRLSARRRIIRIQPLKEAPKL